MKRVCVVVAVLCCVQATAWAQSVALNSVSAQGVIAANGGYVELAVSLIGGFGSVKVHAQDTYSGTWEVQCSADGVNYSGVPLKLAAANDSTVITSVTDTVGLWDVLNAGGCRTVRVIATSGFAASNVSIVISASQTGGGGGGGGSISGDIEVGAQPADDPHFVQCSDGSAAGACAVDLSDEDKGKLDDIISNTASIAAELSGDSAIPVCDATATTFTKNTTAAQEIIAISSTNIPVICAYSVDAEGTTDWKFVSGTGTNCGTGQVDISKNHAFSTTTGYLGETHGNGVGVVVAGKSGEAICLVQSATSVTNFTIRYTYIAP